MNSALQPLRFGHHALAVLGSALLGSTIFALISAVAIAALTRVPLSMTWFAWIAIACWFAAFLVALPGTAIMFSLLWPVTRRGTAAGAWLSVISGATLGIVLAPFASKGFVGTTWTQILLFAFIGAAFGALYVLFSRRLTQSSPSRPKVPHSFRHRLPAPHTEPAA